jgi:transcriptional regulator with XRE-family HTH domain
MASKPARKAPGTAIALKATKAPGLPVNEVLGSRTREVRKGRGVSQATTVKVMDEHGFHMLRSSLAKSELGSRDTSVPELLALAHALDVSPAFLLTPPPGQLLWLAGTTAGTTEKPVVLTPEQVWAWFGGERLRPDGWETFLPEHEAKRREEDDILAQAEAIRAQRALEGERTP